MLSTIKLRVNEIFSSIQGESTHAGLPCTFIRLTGCNLRCSYCDTRYAFDEGTWMTVPDILHAQEELGNDLVEVTGGEPLLQEHCPELLRALIREGRKVLVETNGSLDVGGLPRETVCIMDMKCPSSEMNERMDMENLQRMRRQDELKFVIQNRRDYDWARQCLERIPPRSAGSTLFSPCHNRIDPRNLAEWILADGLPVRLQLPMHRLLWPDSPRGK